MHRAILIQCLPCLAALAGAFVLLVGLVRLSGARFDWRRLRRLHRCQDGGVQSLAFVLTLPLTIMVIQFIVQVSQLMIGVMVVNYAAYAAARSACVWVPAEVPGLPQNFVGRRMLPGSQNMVPVTLARRNSLFQPRDAAGRKFREIGLAAVLACAPVAPSRNLSGADQSLLIGSDSQALQRVYRSMTPAAVQDARTGPRLANKLAYSMENTVVWIGFEAKNPAGPSYNPPTTYDEDGKLVWRHRDNEIDWQDPLTVFVIHNFALLPGPGRFLARPLVGSPDHVSGRIDSHASALYGEPFYTVPIEASATFTNEGMKALLPVVHDEY